MARAIIHIDYTPGEPGSYRGVRVTAGTAQHQFASANVCCDFAEAAKFAHALGANGRDSVELDPSCFDFIRHSLGRYVLHADAAGSPVAVAENNLDPKTRALRRRYLAALPTLKIGTKAFDSVLQGVGAPPLGNVIAALIPTNVSHWLAHFSGMLHVYDCDEMLGMSNTCCGAIAEVVDRVTHARPNSPALHTWLRNVVRSFPGALEVVFRSQRRRKIESDRLDRLDRLDKSDGPDAAGVRWDYTYAYHYLVEETEIPALCAWIEARLSPAALIQDIAERSGPARQRMDADHPRWGEFLSALAGPQGCNLHVGPNGTPEAVCGGDQQSAIRILEQMGFAEAEIGVSCGHFEARGCPCDCHVLMLAADDNSHW